MKPEESRMSLNKFIGSSLLLFVDITVVAATNWIFWVVISKIATTSEIGHATTIYSLALLAMTLTQFGLEYPLLKKSAIFSHRSKILGTAILIQLAITTMSVPFVIYVIDDLYHEPLQETVWMAIGILVLSSIGFITRYTLLGISNVRIVLVIDIIATVTKFLVAYILVYLGLGASGLLIAFLALAVVTTGATLAILRQSFSFRFGGLKYAKEILKDGLVNTPSKLSRTVIFSLSVVLLGTFGISHSEIGIFYVILMISVAVSGLASSMAYMSIPASSEFKTDLSSGSIRIGLSLTTPIVAAFIVAPNYILSLIGSQYVSAEPILLILSIAILPSSIVINIISKFNNLENSPKLIWIGIIQISTFLCAFILLVPHYGTLGAALSILTAFMASAIPSIVWSGRELIRYIMNCCVAVLSGVTAGYFIALIGNKVHPLAIVVISISVTLAIIFALKNTSTTEMSQLIKTVIKGKTRE